MQYLKIKSIKKIPTKDRYDLTVESTHNFFANGILIHNTSHISAYVLCKRPTKWWKFWDKVDTVYDYLYSSRSVIKNANYNSTKNKVIMDVMFGIMLMNI